MNSPVDPVGVLNPERPKGGCNLPPPFGLLAWVTQPVTACHGLKLAAPDGEQQTGAYLMEAGYE